MDDQDKKINSNLILAVMAAIILGILIAFYYSYAQSKSEISFLEDQKAILTKDLTLMKANIDQLEARDEVSEIELQKSKETVDRLLDSVGRLTFTIQKLREYKTELRRLDARNDSLEIKNNFLKYTNMQLTERNENTQTELDQLRNSLGDAEAEQRRVVKEVMAEAKTKVYLQIDNTTASAWRIKGGKGIQTNKASVVEKLEGYAVVAADPSLAGNKRILYFQFLGNNMQIIEDNATTINVNGNVYSKRHEFTFDGTQTDVRDVITMPEGSLNKGTYTLNVFEDEKLLDTTEFILK